jgi:hypothetical protein
MFRVNTALEAGWRTCAGGRASEYREALRAKPCALQQGLEVPVDDVQGVHQRADSAEHEAVIPPIEASSAWGEPSTACSHRTLEMGLSVP